VGDGGVNAPLDLRNPIRPWENVIWTPEPLFRGEMVFVLASGPSLTQSDVDKLRDRRVIAVNSSCKMAPWADVLYFTDNGWYEARKDLVKHWLGLVVSMSRLAKRELDDPEVNNSGKPRVLRVKGCGDPTFPPYLPGMPRRFAFPAIGSPEIHQGRNSGNTAVSLAIAMGAAVVALLGFDCRVVNGREHCHDEYRGPRDLSLYDNEFKHAFHGWNDAALNSGVRIVNCTHGSAIAEFPFADLDEVLAECAHS
jgi:hypothetical protein